MKGESLVLKLKPPHIINIAHFLPEIGKQEENNIMFSLNTKEREQEVTNSNGAVFFVETSDFNKFHVFDRATHTLIGKVITGSNLELSQKVEEMVSFD